MTSALKASTVRKRPVGNSIDLVIDPKTPDLDSLVRDILRVAGKAMALIPSCVVKSVEVLDGFAVVRVVARSGREGEIRLFRKEEGEWEIRVCVYR